MPSGFLTTEGRIKHHADLVALGPVADNAKMHLPEQARVIFDDFIVLKPASFWSPVYVRQLAQLSEAIYLLGMYQEYERKALDKKKPDFAIASGYIKKVNEKLTVVKHLQNLLQLTPRQINGTSRDVNKALDQDVELREIISDDNDLYA